jgi:hypothetical protein
MMRAPAPLCSLLVPGYLAVGIAVLLIPQTGSSVCAAAENRGTARDLIGQGAWLASNRKGEEAPASPKVVSPGLTGSGQAALFYMRGYNSDDNTGAERAFPAISGNNIVVELTAKPSSRSRCLTVCVRSDGSASAYIRFNGKKQGWCQQYDDAGQYRDIAPYKENAENVLKIQLNTATHKLRAWVNGVGGDEWSFRAPVSSVSCIDLFMTHGNGPAVRTLVDNLVVRDDTGRVVLAEDFEGYRSGDAGSQPASQVGDVPKPSRSAVSSPQRAGDVSVSPSGHYVTYKGKALMVIADSATQCVMQNTNIDYRQWIDDCAARGIRGVHLWSFKAPKQKQNGSLVEDRFGYVYPGISPWPRKTTGPDATDQLKQWNLQAFDEGPDGDRSHYWPRLRDLCRYAKSKDMLVGVTVFFGWPKHNSAERPDWAYHPLNVVNGGPVRDRHRMVTQVQLIETPGTEVWMEAWSDAWPARKKTQWIWERFCKKLIEDLAPFGNVFFVFMDEHSYSEGNGGDHFLRFFASRGQLWMDWDKRRPAVAFVCSDTAEREDRNAAARLSFRATPTRPYFLLEGGPYQGDRVRTSLWTFSMGGGHYTFHADEGQETVRTGIMGYDPHVPGGGTGMDKRDWLGHASRFFNQHVIGLDGLAPHNELVAGGPCCLANPGREYVIYAPIGSGPSFTLNLAAAAGKILNCRFYDPRRGRFDAVFNRPGGSTESFAKPQPESSDWVLHVTAAAD